MKILIVVMAALGAVDCVAENILFVGDSTVTHLENPDTGKPVLDALIDSGHEVRLWQANENECSGLPGGFLSKIESSADCLDDLYEWADTVVLLSGGHDLLIDKASAKDRAVIAGRIREQAGERRFVWFDTARLLGESWDRCRVDFAHLNTEGYERLFAEINL